MKDGHIPGVLDALDLDTLADLLPAPLTEGHSKEELARGLRQAVGHTLRVNGRNPRATRVAVSGRYEINPLALPHRRDLDGPLLLRTDYRPGRPPLHPVVLLAAEARLPATCPRPGWGPVPAPRHGAPLLHPDVDHLLEHAERWMGSTTGAVRARLSPALREAEREIHADPSVLAPYYYLPSDSKKDAHWCWVAPLRLDPRRPAVPAVLRPTIPGWQVPTVLPRFEAFWNVVTVGVWPPSWLRSPSPLSLHSAA